MQSKKNSMCKIPLPFVLQKHCVTSTWTGNEKYLGSLEAKKVFELIGFTKLEIVYDTLIMLHNIFAFSDTVSIWITFKMCPLQKMICVVTSLRGKIFFRKHSSYSLPTDVPCIMDNKLMRCMTLSVTIKKTFLIQIYISYKSYSVITTDISLSIWYVPT